jgi:VCBS repeat-containing protein
MIWNFSRLKKCAAASWSAVASAQARHRFGASWRSSFPQTPERRPHKVRCISQLLPALESGVAEARWPLPLCHRTPGRFALLLTLLLSTNLHAGWVAETSAELTTQGDWNADGTLDLLVLDRATGSLRVGLANGSAIDWQEPIPTGVEAATSIAFGQFTYMGQPKVGLAVTSPSLNRVQVIHPLVAEPQALVMQGLGPNALVSMAGGPAGGGNLIAASTLNAEPTPWHLTQLGSTSAPGDALMERGNEIASDLYGFIARQQPAESFRLHQFSAGALIPQAWKIAPGVPTGSDWATGQFTATASKREYLFWQSGQTTLHVRTFDQATAPPDFNAGVNFDLGQAIDEVAVLTGTTPPRLLVIFGGGTTAGVFDFDGVNAPVLAHTLMPEPGQTFRNALAANGGDFHLLSGAAGSPTSDSARRWRRQPDGSYIADPASPMPVIRPGSRRANLLLYVGEPFVDDNARLVSALSTRDWTTAANGIPGMIQATAEIFQSSTAGLGQPASVSLGASSYGPTHALPSQYADDVSISLYSAPVGLIGPELRLSPPPGRYAGTLNVVINSEGLSPANQVLYRTDPTQPWQSYDAVTKPPIAITGMTQLQAYAVSGGAAITPIVGGMYFIGTGSSPAVPFTLAATGITATSAMLNASVDPNGSATTALFDYGTTTALGTSTTGQAIGSGDSALPVSTEVTGLQAHTTYHFRAKATSAEGTNLGQRLTFTTANRPPVFADASFNGSEDAPLTDTLSATDADSDALTFTLLTSASNGALVVNANGSFTFTPTTNYHGTTSFTVKAADAFGGEDTATITLVISPVNDVPVALAQTLAGFRDTPLTINLTADDEEGGPFTLWEILTPPAHGTLTGTAPYLEYTPAANYSGPDSLTFRVKDEGPAFSNSAVVTIQISPNSPPGNVRTWVGGTTGLWSDNVSWDPTYVPTSQNRVIVNSLDRANLNVDARIGQLDLSGQIEGTHHLQADQLNFMAASLGTNAKTLTGGTFTAYDVRVAHFMVLDAAVLNSTSSLFGVGNPGFPDPSITLELKNGSTLNNSGTMGLNNNSNITGSGGANRFNNSGTFTHSRNPQYISDLDVSVEITNSGTFRQESGTIYMQGSHPFRQTAGELFVKEFCGMYSDGPILIEGGKVTGGGQLHASAVTVTDGTLAPGGQGSFDRRGQLRISNLSLSAQSKLSIDIGDSSSDLIEAWTASAPLERNGNLEIFFVEGAHISVQPSQSFTILTCYHSGTGSPQTTTGQFSNVVAGRVDTADGFGSFAVNAAGTSSVVLSDFQPYPFFQWYTDLATYYSGIRQISTPNGETLNWGVRPLNQPAPPATLVINNAGRAPLTGISATVTGTHASEFVITTPPGASSLNPGQSTSFVITFTPTAQGDRTAILEMTSNDPQTPTVLVELRGRGNTPPVLSLPASPLIVDATSQYGAYADFIVSATDIDDTSPPTAIATPASGTYFLMGDTVVNVSATDASGATTTGSFIVRVRFPPPLLATLAPTPVIHTAATLRGTVTPRGLPTSVYFEYGLTTSYGSTTFAQAVGAGFTPMDVSAVISDLQPQTEYHCRLVATSELGTFIGHDMPFTTLPIAAAPVPVADSYSTLANEALYLDSNVLMANDLPGPSALPFQIVSVGNEVNCFLVFYGSYIYFVPDQDFTGIASFSYTVANEQGGSASTTVTVQVDAPPVQPYIGGAATLAVVKNGVSPWLNFTVRPEPNATDITVIATSDNPALLPASRIDFAGTGTARRLRLRPVCEQTGQAVITLTATSLDNLTATASFHVNVVAGVNPQIASIVGLGALPQENVEGYASSAAADVSADGGVVVGASYGRPSGPFIWTPNEGLLPLGEDASLFSHQVTAVSADGLVVAGFASSAEGQRGFLWTSLDGYLALPPDTQVHDVSADGSIAVGFRQYYTPTFDLITEPIRRTAAGVTTLAIPAGFIETRATGISSDGSTIIGYGMDSTYTIHAVVWPVSGPPILLPSLPAAYYTRAHDISADGSVIVGYSSNNTTGQNEAVRWLRDATGSYLLNALFSGPGTISYSTEAQSVSADGTKIVGSAADTSGPFVWDGGNGMRPIATVLSIAGLDISHDWTHLGEQCAISADGKFIVGSGYRQDYRTEAFRIELPHAPTAPLISPIANLSTNADTATAAIPFTLSDPDSNPECLVLTADSSNPSLIPLTNIVFGGSGASRTVTVTPAAGQSGMALIVITANDGFSTSMEDFTLTVGAPIQNWRQQYFGTTSNSGDAADLADPDRDGRTNLEEFAFGMSPLAGLGSDLEFNGTNLSRRGAPIARLQSGQPQAIFCRRADWQAAALTYTVLFSANLIHKVPSATIPTVLATDGEIEVVAIPYPAAIEVSGQNVVPQFFQVQIMRGP